MDDTATMLGVEAGRLNAALAAAGFGGALLRSPFELSKAAEPCSACPDDRTLLFGSSTIDLIALEQLTGRAQIRAIGLALAWAAEARTDDHVPDILDATMDALSQGLDTFDEFKTGDVAGFRRQELAAILNRLRSLRVG